MSRLREIITLMRCGTALLYGLVLALVLRK